MTDGDRVLVAGASELSISPGHTITLRVDAADLDGVDSVALSYTLVAACLGQYGTEQETERVAVAATSRVNELGVSVELSRESFAALEARCPHGADATIFIPSSLRGPQTVVRFQ